MVMIKHRLSGLRHDQQHVPPARRRGDDQDEEEGGGGARGLVGGHRGGLLSRSPVYDYLVVFSSSTVL